MSRGQARRPAEIMTGLAPNCIPGAGRNSLVRTKSGPDPGTWHTTRPASVPLSPFAITPLEDHVCAWMRGLPLPAAFDEKHYSFARRLTDEATTTLRKDQKGDDFFWLRADCFARHLLGEAADSVDLIELSRGTPQVGSTRPPAAAAGKGGRGQ